MRPTLNQLITKTETERNKLIAERNARVEAHNRLQARATSSDSLDLVDELLQARMDVSEANGRLDILTEQLREYKAEAEDEARVVELQARTQPTPAAQRSNGDGDGEYRAGSTKGRPAARTATNAPMFIRSNRPDVPVTVARGESFGDHRIAREHASARAEQDRLIEGVYNGSFQGMMRAISDTGTNAVVPTAWSNDLIDMARNSAAVLQAGAQLVPMDAQVVNIGRVTGDPTAAFRTEGTTITASDPTLDNVTLTAKSMSCLVVASIEWLQDAINGEELIRNEIAKAMGLKLDLVALYGGITSGAGSINLPTGPNPRGVLAALNALRPANVLGGGAANGTALTGYSQLLDLYWTVANSNEYPNAMIWPTRLAQAYSKLNDTTGQQLRVPAPLGPGGMLVAQDTFPGDPDAGLPFFASNQVQSGMTQGTNTTAADAFLGNWGELIIGQRLGMEIQVLKERYADVGQVGFVCTWRGDVQPARTSAFGAYRYLTGN